MERARLNCKRILEIVESPLYPENAKDLSDLEDLLARFRLFISLKSKYNTDKILKHCSGCLKIVSLPQGALVYTTADRCESIYIILEGSIQLQTSQILYTNRVRSPNSHRSATLTQDPNSYLKQFRNTSISPAHLRLFSAPADLKSLSISDTFGDEPLNNKAYRDSTAIVLSTCTLISLHKSYLQSAIKNAKKSLLIETQNFLLDFPFFSSWTKASILKISPLFTLEVVSKNQHLFKEGDDCETVFFVKKGEFGMMKSVKSSLDKGKDFSDGRILKLGMMKKKRNERIGMVSIKGEKEIIGIEEVVDESKCRFTCLCLTDSAELLRVAKDVFMTKIMFPEAVAAVKKQIESSGKWIKARMEALEKLERAKATLDFKELILEKQEESNCEGHQRLKLKGLKKRRHLGRSMDRGSPKEVARMVTPRPKSFFVSTPRNAHYKKSENTNRMQPPPNFMLKFRQKLKLLKPCTDNQIFYTLP